MEKSGIAAEGEVTMAKKKRTTMFVIFDGPQHGGPGTRYIAKDGSTTDTRSQAARFHSHAEAKDFADKVGIVLTNGVYIGQEEELPPV